MTNRGTRRLPTKFASIMAVSMVMVASGFFLLPVPAAAGAAPPQASAPHANDPAEVTTKQIPVPPPPMGWSSWNSFSNKVDSAIIMAQTKAMVASGMQKAGYRTINIDEGWWLGKRDQNGNIVVDPKQWPALKPGEQPGDMSNIVRYIHSFGLKAGIYTDAGKSGCSFYGPDIGPPRPNTGSEGHYDQDFLQFARWGFDYVKVDWCGGNGENLDPAVQYTAVANAIGRAERITGHRMFYSICNWGKNSPWTWAPGIGGVTSDMWRTSGDIVAPIVANSIRSGGKASFQKVLSNFDLGIHPEAQHTGFYNDSDMMVLGMPGLSETQNRVHMSLWAISGAPLIVGADLTKLSQVDLAILTNPEVIAIDQGSLGLQAVKVAEPAPGLQVWSKPLFHSGERAVVLLNRTTTAASIPVTWGEIGLNPSQSAAVRDVWAHKNLGPARSGYTATVPAGDAKMLVVHGAQPHAIVYEAASSANELDGGATAQPCANCGGSSVAIGGKRTLTFRIAPMQGPTYIRIAYINGSQSTRLARMKANGQIGTEVSFQPTGGEQIVGTVTVEANLKPVGRHGSLIFSAPCAPGPRILSISLFAASR